MAQSPPPPQLSLEYNFQNRQRELQAEDHIASACSLPNFKMLDNQLQQQQFLNKHEINIHTNATSNNISSLSGAAAPDDFVFIESV